MSGGLHPDAPISSAAEDRLGRATLAKLIAAEILQAPAETGFVLALMGPWGAGKTSVLNLVEGELDDQAEVLRFDPWLFSGAEQLVTRFFSELGSQLSSSRSDRVQAVAEQFSRYGEAVSPLVPLVFGPTGAAVAAVVQQGWSAVTGKGKRTSALNQRRDLQRRLVEMDRPIAVFVDDIDRLRAYLGRSRVACVESLDRPSDQEVPDGFDRLR